MCSTLKKRHSLFTPTLRNTKREGKCPICLGNMDDSRTAPVTTGLLFFLMFSRVLCSPKIQGILYNSVVATFNLSNASAGFFFSLMNASSFLLAPVGKLMSDYTPFRLNFSISLLITGLSLSSVSLVTSSFGLAACFLAIGTGISIQLTNGHIYLSKVCGDSYPFYSAIVSAATSVGIVILPFVVQFLLDTYGVFGSYLIMGALIWNGLPVVCCMRSKKANLRKEPSKNSQQENNTDILKSLRLAVCPTDDAIVTFTIGTAAFLHQFLYFAFNLYIIPYAESRPDFDIRFVSLIASVSGAGGVVGKIAAIVCFYFLTDKHKISVIGVYSVFCLVLASTLALYDFSNLISVWLCLTFLNGLVLHFHVSMMNGIVNALVKPEEFPNAVSFKLFMYGVGEISSGIISGAVYETCDCYETLFYALSCASVLNAILMVPIMFCAN